MDVGYLHDVKARSQTHGTERWIRSNTDGELHRWTESG